MQKIGMLCFTLDGCETMRRLRSGFLKKGYEVTAYIKTEYASDGWQSRAPEVVRLEDTAANWTGAHFQQEDGLIYIGAVGIAVRLLAPYIQDKTQDPAVVVVDEQGVFAVSLLSGHLGGANEMTALAAEILSAVPVITTATDRRQLFAVDLFAGKNGLTICDMAGAKAVSAALLAGQEVDFYSEFSVSGICPPELRVVPALFREQGAERRLQIAVSIHHKEYLGGDSTLLLVPRAVVLGIGCRRGVSEVAVEAAVTAFLEENQIEACAVFCMASIDIKKEEPALISFCKKRNLKLVTFSAEELAMAEGSFTESDFVKSVTGVSNVCERAAVCGCQEAGTLLIHKAVYKGVTVAAARLEVTVGF